MVRTGSIGRMRVMFTVSSPPAMDLHDRLCRSLKRRLFRECVVDDFKRWRSIAMLIAARHVAAEIERTSSRPRIGVMLPTSVSSPRP